MDLKSMALTKNIMMGEDVVADVGYSNKGINEEKTEEYPYCLKLHLTQNELTKLGVDEMPALESEMSLIAKVKVVGARSENDQHSLELQITEMLLGKPKKEQEHESMLYGANKAEA